MARKPRMASAKVMPLTPMMAFATFVKLALFNTISTSLEVSETVITKKNISSNDRPLPFARAHPRATAAAKVTAPILPSSFKSL